ncbi:FAD-dependent monooxygenase [Microbacterium terregens]
MTADHVVGADGAHSAVRRKLGIAMHGRGTSVRSSGSSSTPT